MDWKKEAMNDLRKYRSMLQGQENLKEDTESTESSMYSVRSSSVSAVPLHGGGNRYEDKLINSIVKQEQLKLNSEHNDKRIRMIQRGLSILTETEYRVLEKFYINRTSIYMDELMDEFHFEKTRIYEIKDEALYKFTIAMYGLTDS